jgi:hypothetical protein
MGDDHSQWTVPLALVGTLGAIIDGVQPSTICHSGLTIAVGFVVDDAIVMLENIYRHIEDGMTPMEAALKGAGESVHHRLDQLVADRGVHPAAAHGRYCRATVPRVRYDGVDHGADPGTGLTDADADDVLALLLTNHHGGHGRVYRVVEAMFDGMLAFIAPRSTSRCAFAL